MKEGETKGGGGPCGHGLRRKVAQSAGRGGGRLQLVAGGEGVRVGHGGGPGPAGRGEHCAGSAHLLFPRGLTLFSGCETVVAVAVAAVIVAVVAAVVDKVMGLVPAVERREGKDLGPPGQQCLGWEAPCPGRGTAEGRGWGRISW